MFELKEKFLKKPGLGQLFVLICLLSVSGGAYATLDDQRRAAVSQVIMGLEAYGADTGSYGVSGTGYAGGGEGWFHYSGGTYGDSIYSGISGYLSEVPSDPLHPDVSLYSSNDFLVYRCSDRVAVFAKTDTASASDADQDWWTNNGCTTYPITNLDHQYFEVSGPVEGVVDDSLDDQRRAAVSQVIMGLEAYGADTGSYGVSGTGYAGGGEGWFHYSGGTYGDSIYSGISGYLSEVPSDPLHPDVSLYSSNDFLVYRCSDRVAVFAKTDTASASDADQDWWTNNGCTTYPITNLDHQYFEVSGPVEGVVDDSLDDQRRAAVSQVIMGLEAYGADTGSYGVSGTGYAGGGEGWFHYSGGTYGDSIYSGISGYLSEVPSDPLHPDVSLYSSNDFLVYRCSDRVAVFAKTDTASASDADQDWWTNNGCTTYPITNLDHQYFEVSGPVEGVVDDSLDDQRRAAVSQVIMGLEAYGADTGSYGVSGTGYAGGGEGWFHYSGGTYGDSIYSGISGYLSEVPSDPLHPDVSLYSSNDFLVYRCSDRVAVFAKTDTASASDADQDWWTNNGCTTYPITNLDHQYFEVSGPVEGVVDDSLDDQRRAAVSQVIMGLEAYGADTGSYGVSGTGYAGGGEGWFHYSGGTYGDSIYSGISGYLSEVPSDPLHPDVSLYSSNDFLVYRCSDRVAVFAKTDTASASDADQDWWTNNGCTTYPITNLDHQYFEVSQSLYTIPINLAPLAVDDTVDENEEELRVEIGSSLIIAVLTNDSDSDGVLNESSVVTSLPDQAVAQLNGTVVYTPVVGTATESPVTFTYTVRDDDGDVSDPATVTVNVTLPKFAPLAADDNAEVTSIFAVNIDVAANDTDADGSIDRTTVATNDATNPDLKKPDYGYTEINSSTGVITYFPTTGVALGTVDTFEYIVKDDEGLASEAATVSITYNLESPVALNDLARVVSGSEVTISILENDTSDAGINPADIVITNSPQHAVDDENAEDKFTVNDDGTVFYKHSDDGSVEDSFSYIVRDVNGLDSNEATVTIEIVPEITVDDLAYVGSQGGEANISVLLNDLTALELDASSVFIVDSPLNAEDFVVRNDGTVFYKHDGQGSTEDSFQYRLYSVDGLLTDEATVTIKIPPIVTSLFSMGDLKYEGAFSLPGDTFGDSSANYAEGVIEANGSSLYLAGHAHDDAIAEFQIPALVTDYFAGNLNTAVKVQDFFSVLDQVSGFSAENKPNQITGLERVDGSLVVNAMKYYDGSGNINTTTLLLDDADNLKTSSVSGFHRMEGAVRAAGWISNIPAPWKDTLDGTYISGHSSGYPIISRLSVGPSAFLLDFPSALNTSASMDISAKELQGFTLDNPLLDSPTRSLNGGGEIDDYLFDNSLWTHLSTAQYGFIVPGTRTYMTIGFSGGHESGVGYKQDRGNCAGDIDGYCANDESDVYNYYWLWDMDDWFRVQNGEIQPHEIMPYDAGEFNLPFQGETYPDQGAPESFEPYLNAIGGASFDESTGLLYLSIVRANVDGQSYDNPPVVVAFSIAPGNGSTSPEAVTSLQPNSEVDTETPPIEWMAASGATRYYAQIINGATRKTLYSSVVDALEVCSGNACQVTPVDLLLPGGIDLLLRVRSENDDGFFSAWKYQEFSTAVFDDVAPELSITSPNGDTQAPVSLLGNASDNVGLESVVVKLTDSDGNYWNGNAFVNDENAQVPISGIALWSSESIALLPGNYTVQATAYDTSGNSASAEVSFEVLPEVSGPEVTITSPLASAGGIALTGTAEGEADIDRILVLVDGVEYESSPSQGTNSWGSYVALPPGTYTVQVTVYDESGNSTTTEPVTFTVQSAMASAPNFCPAYDDSSLYRERSSILTISPNDDWEQQIEQAEAGTVVVMTNGTYVLDRQDLPQYPDANTVLLSRPNVTIRSLSGNPEDVVIVGDYSKGDSQADYNAWLNGTDFRNDIGLMVAADGITVADITIRGMLDHAISMEPTQQKSSDGTVNPGTPAEDGVLDGTYIYNVVVEDNGTQQIKGNDSGSNRGAVIACSSIGYPEDDARGDFINGIEIFQGIDVVVRDNVIENINGDGTGCSVSDIGGPCPYTGSGSNFDFGYAISMNQSSGTVIERNQVLNSKRGVTTGVGGIVRNNFIYRSDAGDEGIRVQGSTPTVVEHNTVFSLLGDAPINVAGSGHEIRNNLTNAAISVAGNSTVEGNIESATEADFIAPGDFHLATTSSARGEGVATSVAYDLDGESRSGAGDDVGADEFNPDYDPENPPVEPPEVSDFVAVDDEVAVGRNGSVNIPVLANDSEMDITLDSVIVNVPDNHSPGQGDASVSLDGTITYTHNGQALVNTPEIDSFNYEVIDSSGAVSNLATVTVQIFPAEENLPPQAFVDTAVVDAASGTAVIDVLANDVDDGNDINVNSLDIVFQVNGVNYPQKGTLITNEVNGNKTGYFTYTPYAGETGTDAIYYVIADNDGNVSDPPGRVDISLSGQVEPPVQNIAPEAVNDTVDEDGLDLMVAIGNTIAIDVLANDSDSDGNLVGNTVVTSIDDAVPQTDGTVFYTPAANTDVSEPVTFTYTVQDNDGATSNSATVTVNVVATALPNEAPVAVPDNATVIAGKSVVINVAQNDTDSDGVVSADTVELIGAPSSGDAEVNGNGTITYTPAGNNAHLVTFTYRVKDDDAELSNDATVTVRVSPVITSVPFCPAYEDSPMDRARANTLVISANDDDWEQQIEAAASGTEILLEDGTYQLHKPEFPEQNTVFLANPDITIRSLSGNRDAVIIRGDGYPGKRTDIGFMVAAHGITIADLSMHEMQDHAISMQPGLVTGDEVHATYIYNVHAFDIGTQHIKGNTGGINRNAVVACSLVGYTDDAVVGEYIGGVDIHSGADVLIRDNYFYNITGDGSGCNAANMSDCQYLSAPAVYMNASSDSIVERNIIEDSYRGISLGLVGGHTGGIVRNNFVYLNEGFSYQNELFPLLDPKGDAGISIENSTDTVVEHNTVYLNDANQGPIEARSGSGHAFRNNLTNAPIWIRDGASNITQEGNIEDATASYFVAPGDPHLSGSSAAIGAGVTPSEVAIDIDGDVRTGKLDVGADQFTGSVNQPPVAVNDGIEVQSGQAVLINVLSNDDDSDGNLVASTVELITYPLTGSAEEQVDSNGIKTGAILYVAPAVSDTTTETFSYRVQDDNQTPSNSATVTVTVVPVELDTTAPVVAIASPEADADIESPVSISGSASDDVALDRVEVKVTDSAGDETTLEVTGTESWSASAALAAGDYTVQATAFDTSGNSTASTAVSFTVIELDTTAPVVAIASPEADADIESPVSISGSASDDVALDRVEVKVTDSAGDETTLEVTGTESWSASAALAAGDYTVQATAFDTSGNSTASTAVSFTVIELDTTAPVVAIASPEADADIESPVSISGSASDDVALDRVEVKVTDSAGDETTLEVTGAESWSATETLPPGDYSVQATAFDTSGNSTASTAVSFTVIELDTTAPVVAIASPEADADIESPVSISGSASDDVALDRVEVKLTDSAGDETTLEVTGTESWSASAALAAGDYTVQATAFDTSGNSTASTAVSFTVIEPDTTAPVVAIASPEADADIESPVSISGSASDDVALDRVEVKVTDSAGDETTLEVTGTESWSASAALAAGDYTVQATAFDTTGNTVVSDAVSFTVVAFINNAPLATSDTLEIESGATVTIAVLENDSDPDNQGGANPERAIDPGSIRILAADPLNPNELPLNGSVTIDNVNGIVEYTHDGNSELTSGFRYVVADLQGLESNVAQVTITIDTQTNQALEAVNDIASVTAGSFVVIDVLDNDTGPYNPATVDIAIGTDDGWFDIDDVAGTIKFTPYKLSLAVAEQATFGYTVRDTQGVNSNVGIVTVTIEPNGPVIPEPPEPPPSGNVLDLASYNLQWGNNPMIADDAGSRLFVSLPDEFSTPEQLSDVVTYTALPAGYELSIEDTIVASGDSLTATLQHGDKITVEILDNGASVQVYDLVVTNLPIFEVWADNIVDEPKLPGTWRWVDGASGADTGVQNLGIEFRGDTSQAFDKKSFAFETRDIDDPTDSDNVRFFDLRNDDDWIADAAYRDLALVRNIVSHDIYRSMRSYAYIDANDDEQGSSTIAGGVAEMILNGRYHGLYVISERVDRKLLGLEKVDVPEDANGNDLWSDVDFTISGNGSMLYKADGNDSGFYNPGTIEQNFEQKYPDPDDVERFEPLADLVNFINDSTPADFAAEIGDLVDLDSFADFWILRLVTSNPDTMKKNYYIARNESGKWFFVPWDFDATFGMGYTGAPDSNSIGFIGTYQNQLLHRLFEEEVISFSSIVKARWQELRGTILTPQSITARFESYFSVMGVDQTGSVEQGRNRNLQRWPGSGNTGSNNPELGEAAFIEDWLTDRIDYLDTWIINNLP